MHGVPQGFINAPIASAAAPMSDKDEFVDNNTGGTLRFHDNSGAGFVFNTSSTGANIFIDQEKVQLRQRVKQLEQQIDEAARANKQLFNHAQTLEHEVNRLRSLSLAKPDHPFTQKELKLMLSKLHPDKHDGKPIYNEITRKLVTLK